MQQNHLTIRPFAEADTEAVIGLWDECGLIVSHNNPHRDIARKLRVNPEWFLVGEINGAVAATCMVGYEGHRGWINYLAVRPDLQRHGLGAQMMARAEELLQAVGCAKINLQIRATNQAVVRFYESLGYTQDPAISMGKRLVPDTPDADTP